MKLQTHDFTIKTFVKLEFDNNFFLFVVERGERLE